MRDNRLPTDLNFCFTRVFWQLGFSLGHCEGHFALPRPCGPIPVILIRRELSRAFEECVASVGCFLRPDRSASINGEIYLWSVLAVFVFVCDVEEELLVFVARVLDTSNLLRPRRKRYAVKRVTLRLELNGLFVERMLSQLRLGHEVGLGVVPPAISDDVLAGDEAVQVEPLNAPLQVFCQQ